MRRLTPGQLRRRAREGDALRELRENKPLRISEAARRAGIDADRLIRIEQGKRPASNEVLFALARAYDEPLEALYSLLDRQQSTMFKRMAESLEAAVPRGAHLTDEERQMLIAYLDFLRTRRVMGP